MHETFEAKVWRNFRIFVSAVALVIFFFSIGGILRKVTGGSDSYPTYFLCLVIALLIFGSDGNLGELIGKHSDYAAISVVSGVGASAGAAAT
jgi:hypothetical protein